MEKQINFSEKQKNLWISLTGYRSLVVLKSLIEKKRTINELIKILQEDKIANKSVSKDTIRVTINTLKSSGCEISRPSKANQYTYELISHPFGLNIQVDEIEALIKLREKLTEELSWNEVLSLNNLYEKIFDLSENKEQINQINETKPLANLDIKILKTLSKENIQNKKIQIIYNSAEKGNELIEIISKGILYENGKLYLKCYIFKYNAYSILNFERIKEVKTISLNEYTETPQTYNVEYSISGNAVINYEKESYETIIEKDDNKITIKANVTNEFLFIQRLLLFGSDFKIISPIFFREKLINKIKAIQKGYQK